MSEKNDIRTARPRLQINPPVFFTSGALTLVFVLATVVAPEVAGSLSNRSSSG
jgi:choline/glycine/proline betaine transport protein